MKDDERTDWPSQVGGRVFDRLDLTEPGLFASTGGIEFLQRRKVPLVLKCVDEDPQMVFPCPKLADRIASTRMEITDGRRPLRRGAGLLGLRGGLCREAVGPGVDHR